MAESAQLDQIIADLKRREAFKLYPYPEACDGEPWRFTHGPLAFINFGSRTIQTPTTAGAHAFSIRRHEVAHVRVTGATDPVAVARRLGCTVDTVQAVEDGRVNPYVRAVLPTHPNIRWDNGEQRAKLIALLRDSGAVAQRILGAVASHGLDEDRVFLPTDSAERRIVRHIRNLLRSSTEDGRVLPASDENRDEACRILAKLIPEKGSQLDDLGGIEANGLDSPDGSPRVASHARKPAEWAPMEVCSPRLPDRLPTARARVRGRSRSSGVSPRRMARWCVDRRVFVPTVRRAGGSVLIDISGSMDLDPAEVRLMIETAPASLIGCYCSRNHGEEGRLTVIGLRGRYADSEVLKDASIGAANGCDGPALRWLSRQAKPRVWVSDGLVTGRGESTNVELYREVAGICRGSMILRVPTALQAAAVLRGGRALHASVIGRRA